MNVEAGDYFGVGLTVRGTSPSLFGWARARGAIDLGAEAPDWGELSALGGAEAIIARRLALGLSVSGFVLGYSGPSQYRAGAGYVQPSVRVGVGRFGFMVQGRGWLGRTSVLLREGQPFVCTPWSPCSPSGGDLSLTTDLELLEASTDAWVLANRVLSMGVGADLAQVEVVTDTGGAVPVVDMASYVGGRAWVSVRPTRESELIGNFQARQRRATGETQAGFVLSGSYDVDPDVRVEVALMRTLEDLLLGSPETVAVSVSVQLRLGERDSKSSRRSLGSNGASTSGGTRIAEILDWEGGVRRIRFSLQAPDADSVAVVGDFTRWEPAEMRRGSSGRWSLVQLLAPGVYRYAFQVDGVWHVPEGAAGQVDDGFGQKNLMVVVPGSD